MIELSINKLLELAQTNKKIKTIPTAPKPKIEIIKKIYKKDKEIIEGIELYEFFRRVPNLDKTKEQEFRKNVTLKIQDKSELVEINMDKLKEYAETIETFINKIKEIL